MMRDNIFVLIAIRNTLLVTVSVFIYFVICDRGFPESSDIWRIILIFTLMKLAAVAYNLLTIMIYKTKTKYEYLKRIS